jgi:hypothetical protein
MTAPAPFAQHAQKASNSQSILNVYQVQVLAALSMETQRNASPASQPLPLSIPFAKNNTVDVSRRSSANHAIFVHRGWF